MGTTRFRGCIGFRTPKVCKIMEKKMETTKFRGYIGFRV